MSNFETPVEIDTKLAELYQSQEKARVQFDRIRRSLDEKRYTHYTENDRLETEAVLERLGRQIAPLEDAYTGWSRYFHVTNVNGHIHTSMSCSSCFPDTQFGWRTDLSGLTEEEVVEREAYNACSVCMPIAPAEQKAARERYNKEQREARAAEKQAKKDEKLRKAAERAVKFLAKVEKVVAKEFGSWERIWSDYSLYGKDGKKSLYDASFDLPQQVADYLYDEMERHSGAERPMRHMKDPKGIIAEAREKGLID